MEKFWKSISAVEAKEIIKQKSHAGDFCILDVRTEKEFLSGAIPGAINLDIYAQDFSQKLNALDKNKTYLIYCRSGNRSKSALSLMKQLGFQYVYELDGGIISS
ncbi:MAG: rhodanese-like domain-containing protein [Parcubacteria group bacterium]|jgi:rhodanese-related sulfurtransferase